MLYAPLALLLADRLRVDAGARRPHPPRRPLGRTKHSSPHPSLLPTAPGSGRARSFWRPGRTAYHPLRAPPASSPEGPRRPRARRAPAAGAARARRRGVLVPAGRRRRAGRGRSSTAALREMRRGGAASRSSSHGLIWIADGPGERDDDGILEVVFRARLVGGRRAPRPGARRPLAGRPALVRRLSAIPEDFRPAELRERLQERAARSRCRRSRCRGGGVAGVVLEPDGYRNKQGCALRRCSRPPFRLPSSADQRSMPGRHAPRSDAAASRAPGAGATRLTLPASIAHADRPELLGVRDRLAAQHALLVRACTRRGATAAASRRGSRSRAPRRRPAAGGARARGRSACPSPVGSSRRCGGPAEHEALLRQRAVDHRDRAGGDVVVVPARCPAPRSRRSARRPRWRRGAGTRTSACRRRTARGAPTRTRRGGEVVHELARARRASGRVRAAGGSCGHLQGEQAGGVGRAQRGVHGRAEAQVGRLGVRAVGAVEQAIDPERADRGVDGRAGRTTRSRGTRPAGSRAGGRRGRRTAPRAAAPARRAS